MADAKQQDLAAQGGENKDSKFKLTDWFQFIFAGGIGLITTLFGLSSPNASLFNSLFSGVVVAAVAAIAYQFVPEEWKGKITDFLGSMMGNNDTIKGMVKQVEPARAAMKAAELSPEMIKAIAPDQAGWDQFKEVLESSYKGAVNDIYARLKKNPKEVMQDIRVVRAIATSDTLGPARRTDIFKQAVLMMSGIPKNVSEVLAKHDPKALFAAIDKVNGVSGKSSPINFEALLSGNPERFFTADSIEAVLGNETLRGLMKDMIPQIDQARDANANSADDMPKTHKPMLAAVEKALTEIVNDKARFEKLYNDDGQEVQSILVEALKHTAGNAAAPADRSVEKSLLHYISQPGAANVLQVLSKDHLREVFKSAGISDEGMDSAIASVDWLKGSSAKPNVTNLGVMTEMLKEMHAAKATAAGNDDRLRTLTQTVFNKYRTQLDWSNSADALKFLVQEPTTYKILTSAAPLPALAAKMQAAGIQGKLIAGIQYEDLASKLADAKTDIGKALWESIDPATRASLLDGETLSRILKDKDQISTALSLSGVKIEPEKATSLANFISTNHAQLKTILGDDGMNKLAEMITAGDDVSALFSNPTALFSKPDVATLGADGAARLEALQKIILERSISEGQKVEAAIRGLNVEPLKLSGAEKRAFDIFTFFISQKSDLKSATANEVISNLDALAKRGVGEKGNMAVVHAVIGAFDRLINQRAVTKADAINDEVQAAANQTVVDLNANYTELLDKIAPKDGEALIEEIGKNRDTIEKLLGAIKSFEDKPEAEAMKEAGLDTYLNAGVGIELGKARGIE